MKMGTKSLLFGAHQFLLHPLLVAWAWWRLFGFPWKWQLWVCFFLHDAGYWGLPNMDGKEGERHVERGAMWVLRLTDDYRWWRFCLYHSRARAAAVGRKPSALCVADKAVLTITPWWLYLPLVRLTGEIREYQQVMRHRAEIGDHLPIRHTWASDREWYRKVQAYMTQWTFQTLTTDAYEFWPCVK